MSKWVKDISIAALVSATILTCFMAFSVMDVAASEMDGQNGLEKDISGNAHAVLSENAQSVLTTQAVDSDYNILATTLHYDNSDLPEGEYIDNEDFPSDYNLFPVKVDTDGVLYLYAQASPDNTSKVSVAVGIYEESEDKFTYYGRDRDISAGKAYYDIGGMDVETGEICYIGIKSSDLAEAYVIPYVYSYKTRSLSAGKTMIASAIKNGDEDSFCKFKITPKKTGYIKVFIEEYGNKTSGANLTLLNSSKKAISGMLWYSNSKNSSDAVFGVKKGTTYYIKVSGCLGNSSYQNTYGIHYKLYSAPDRKNSSKSNALNLKRKAAYSKVALPANGKKTTKWYKFKVTKERATEISADFRNVNFGNYQILVYYGKTKVLSKTVINGKVNTYKIKNKKDKAKKGTYYIKIISSSKSSGMYKIKYKK